MVPKRRPRITLGVQVVPKGRPRISLGVQVVPERGPRTPLGVPVVIRRRSRIPLGGPVVPKRLCESEDPAIPVVRTSTLQSRIVARPGQPESSTVATARR